MTVLGTFQTSSDVCFPVAIAEGNAHNPNCIHVRHRPHRRRVRRELSTSRR